MVCWSIWCWSTQKYHCLFTWTMFFGYSSLLPYPWWLCGRQSVCIELQNLRIMLLFVVGLLSIHCNFCCHGCSDQRITTDANEFATTYGYVLSQSTVLPFLIGMSIFFAVNCSCSLSLSSVKCINIIIGIFFLYHCRLISLNNSTVNVFCASC